MRRPPRAPSAILTILVGTALGQGTVVAVSPVLTRTYSASDFGTLAVVTAIASVLGAGAVLGTDRALAVAEPHHVRGLVATGLGGTLLAGLATAAPAWVLRGPLAAWFRAPALDELWWVVPVTTTTIGVQRVCSAVLARRRAHRAIAVRNAYQGLGQTAWNLAMAFAGPVGLVGGLAAGRTAAVVGMLRPRAVWSWRRQVAELDVSQRGVSRRHVWRRDVSRAARAHRRFLVLTPWSAMLNVVGQQAPGIVIAAAHGSAAAGLVALTMRVLGSPVGMVADAVSQYAAGAFGLRVRSGSPIRRLLVGLTGRLLVVGGLAALVVVLVGPLLFGAVFGSAWEASGSYARILAPAFAIQVAVSPVSQVLSMLGRQTTQLVWDVARLVSTTGAVLVPSALGAPMPVVLGALAAAMTASYAAMLVLVLFATRGTPTVP